MAQMWGATLLEKSDEDARSVQIALNQVIQALPRPETCSGCRCRLSK